jgi:hypothetical protein
MTVVFLIIDVAAVTFLLRVLAALWFDRKTYPNCPAMVFTRISVREIELHPLPSHSMNSAADRLASPLGTALAGARRERSHSLRLQL